MSKAFLKESDLLDEHELVPPVLLPIGAKNYITPEGARALREQLQHLVKEVRPTLMAQTEDQEVKRQLQQLDRRARRLEESLRTAEIVLPPDEPDERVRFGANVKVQEGKGAIAEYRIVGVDEMDLSKNWITWISPLARALLSSRKGERITFNSPAGPRTIEILEVTYA